MTGKTGEKCQQSGIYYCQTYPTNTIPLAKGETFPPCQQLEQHTEPFGF